MSPDCQLNYAILGHSEFEVFPIDVYREKMLVKDILGYVRKKPNFTPEFWLVRDDMTPDRTKGLTTFCRLPAEGASPFCRS